MSLWSRKAFLAVRILGPDGYYPRFSIRTASHQYEATAGVVWTAVVQPAVPEDWELPETPTLIPEEIRLHAAINLCEGNPWRGGMPSVTLWSERVEQVLDAELDLTSAAGQQRVAHALGRLRPEYDLAYEVGNVGNNEDAQAILANVDVEDELLLAGLANLNTAGRLMTARIGERDAAALCMFVSMQAALEYIRLHLNEARGVGNTSFAEVHSYLAGVYPDGNYLTEYLDELYEHRLMATHPASRLGEYWAVPLMADDFYDLRKHLIVIYRHIVLGETPTLD